MIHVTVSDTGCGISPEHLGKIFDSFFTTKEIGRGTGLGLSSALGIIQRHGGHMECTSTRGIGTEFHLYLPAQTGKVAASLSAIPVNAEAPGGRETLLVVDDDEDLLALNSLLLESVGYKVLSVGNGRDAIARYREHWREIALIVSDLNMPGISAEDYINGLISINPAARIVIASGYLNAAEASPHIANKVACFLGKPCRRADLLRGVRNVLDAMISPAEKQ